MWRSKLNYLVLFLALLSFTVPARADHFNPLIDECNARLTALVPPFNSVQRKQKSALTSALRVLNKPFVSGVKDLDTLKTAASSLNRAFPNDVTFTALLNDLAVLFINAIIDDRNDVADLISIQPAERFTTSALNALDDADDRLDLAEASSDVAAVARQLKKANEKLVKARKFIGVGPVSLAGRIVVVQISSGSGIFPRAGNYTLEFSAEDNTYQLIGSAIINDSQGTYLYSKTESNGGLASASDLNLGSISIRFLYTQPGAGRIYLFANGGFGRQRGIFTELP